jgi:hypothetical protein
LQKSVGGVGPRKPFSVVAESGGKGLARSGEPATGEMAPRPGSSLSWRRDRRRARKSSRRWKASWIGKAVDLQRVAVEAISIGRTKLHAL